MPAMLVYKVIGLIGLTSYAAAYVTGRVPKLRYNRYRIVAVPRTALPAMPRGYSWRELDADALANYTIDKPRESQEKRFAQGLRCVAIFDRQDQLAAVSWLGMGKHFEGDVPIEFAPPEGAAWDTGLWIPQEKRMGRAFAAIWAAIGAWMDQNACQWSISCISDYNVASLLAHERMQAHIVGHLMIFNVGKLILSFGAKPKLMWLRNGKTPQALLNLPQEQCAAPDRQPTTVPYDAAAANR
jgi:hypothetical protein